MIYKIDWKETDGDYTIKERLEIVFVKMQEYVAGRKIVLSSQAAFFYTNPDLGSYEWQLFKNYELCGRDGRFFTCSYLKGFSFLLVGDTVDVVELINCDLFDDEMGG